MTSCAFLLGVVPLIIGSGAGAEMRRALGVAMFCGMLGVTVFGVMLTPVFYYLIQRLAKSRLFANPIVRRTVGLLLGPVAGMTFGAFLWLTGEMGFWWSMAVGLGFGLLAAGIVQGLHRRGVLTQAIENPGRVLTEDQP